MTPYCGLVALVVSLPLLAYTVTSRRNARNRELIGLAPPATRGRDMIAALVAVPLLLGIACAGPALRTHSGRRIRTDAQAMFILDTSRSMAAAAGFRAPTRFDEAQTAAIKLRDDTIPDVPSGVASLTTELLPHLFPSPDLNAFNSTVEKAVGVEKPLPPFLVYGVRGTSFGPLAQLRNQGFFNPTTSHRVAILLTDGESGAIAPTTIADALSLSTPPPGNNLVRGLPPRPPEPPVSLIVVRVGSGSDRIYDSNGALERNYRPDPTAGSTVRSLVAAAHGRAFTTGQLGQVGNAIRSSLGSGGARRVGLTTKTLNLAPYFALAALIALGFVIWKRNATNL